MNILTNPLFSFGLKLKITLFLRERIFFYTVPTYLVGNVRLSSVIDHEFNLILCASLLKTVMIYHLWFLVKVIRSGEYFTKLKSRQLRLKSLTNNINGKMLWFLVHFRIFNNRTKIVKKLN
jgi:hypothetical protein